MSTLEEEVLDRFVKAHWTLGLAESCTGGALSARLTAVPNASQYFLGAVICYANEVKERLLGVSQESLQRWGAVSEAVAIEMAQGTLTLLSCEVALAITGIAGPSGGTADKPVGTVWLALAQLGQETVAWKLYRPGSRNAVIAAAVESALSQMIRIAQNRRTMDEVDGMDK